MDYAFMATSNKRIIICCDGTYDDSGDTVNRKQPGSHTSRILRWLLPPFLYHLLWGLRVFKLIKTVERKIFGTSKPHEPFRSNISHLASAIKPCTGDRIHQMVVYVGGIGTLGTPQSRFEEAVTGNTMEYKVRYVYRVIVDNYMDGDEIFLFGYSRGAFTARAVVGLIEWAGILKKSAMPCFDAVWHAYKERLENSNDHLVSLSKQERVAKMVRHVRGVGADDADDDCVYTNPKIICVGVFDTVGSLKAPPVWLTTTDDIEIARKARARYDGLDVDLDEVGNVFQALALDEHRFDFYPSVLARSLSLMTQNFKQTWFAGVHADMGGRNSALLGFYPLIWMVSKLQEKGLLEFDDEYIRLNVTEPVRRTISKTRLQQIRYSHPVDRHPALRALLPKMILPWLRYAPRNPNMPAALAIADPDASISSSTSDRQPLKRVATKEQTFHWTVIDCLKGDTENYWDSCFALRKSNPLEVESEISVADIKARLDPPTGIDENLFKHWQKK